MVEVGGKLVEQFAQNLRQLITDDSQGGGGAEAGTTEARTTEAGATEAGAATDGGASADQATTATQDGPGSTQPSPVISSAAPSAATTTAPPAQASADSINLVKLVGPALLKRVVPVAVVAAVLALLGRRLFRRGGKD
jgi:cytoskeletal protein RodZ